MKKILAIHTGGTISMSQDDSGEVVQNEKNPIANQDNLLGRNIKIVNEELFNLPSPHITPKVMLKIVKRIKEAEDEGYYGVVVTHGTDTLEETAYFLDLTLKNDMPVVVTGAMRSSNEIGSDGLYNLLNAAATAASEDAKGKGVLVVMNDEIHTARYVTKTHTTNVATFRTPTFGPIGIISKHHPSFFQELIQSEVVDINKVIDGVYLIKGFAGMDGTLFDALDNDTTKGLVIEGLGAGNLPPATLPAIQKLLKRHIPIILVSRCINGVAQDIYAYHGGGIELQDMGLTICHGLNGQKARIKLIVGLSAGKSGQELARFMGNAIS
ncbi:asparaginase [Apilactobacillus micheneri]|uniref:Asparaginase n=1 Tax=Apilactobacillus micheneri TaxID=1899430 RepID=A0A9Q8INA8_9LACO|nr:asparaginase [Apilactobacillus micheneri]TPR40981.1 asparaginase [Apilactobacillus micheneri]TPR42561.1 asparaginase [Apilactobacillus micheneri]TPR45530.1 asparaginase [Apilactobacillus micheneri]TPR46088.1 asparaginase [Apilactobacillus micheneri]TPR46773.1 asparaginase [Apilactobacillus micheneri]